MQLFDDIQDLLAKSIGAGVIRVIDPPIDRTVEMLDKRVVDPVVYIRYDGLFVYNDFYFLSHVYPHYWAYCQLLIPAR